MPSCGQKYCALLEKSMGTARSRVRDTPFRGRIAPRGAARAQAPRSAESEGPSSPITRRERAAGLGAGDCTIASTLSCNTPAFSFVLVGWPQASQFPSLRTKPQGYFILEWLGTVKTLGMPAATHSVS